MRSRLALLTMMIAMMAGLVAQGGGALTWAQGQDDSTAQSAPEVDEIVVGGQRYQFDRTVPIDLGQLQQLTDDAGNPIWTEGDGDPLGAVYTQGDPDARRYLPQHLDAPETSCPVASVDVSTIEGGGLVYLPAGLEPDLNPEQLIEVGSTDDGRTLYAISTDQPFDELFATGADGGLVWYIAIGDNGVPTTFPNRMVFAGQEFQLTAAEAPSLEGLQRVGCALRFPALASVDEASGSFSSVHLQAGDTLVTYQAVGPVEPATPEPTQPAIEPATPTLEPTVAPTEPATPTPEPTIAPTEPPTPTPEPTIAPTEPPTPTPEPTIAPTEPPTPTPEPTVPPTESPTPTPERTEPTTAPEPTAVPTDVPTATAEPTAVPTDATQPTTEPADDPTATPPPTPRPTPTPRPLQPQAVIPTVPPEAPPPAASTSVATGCTGNAGPIGADGLPERLPEALQYGGTGYRYVETVNVSELGDLTRLGCVGPFEAFRGDGDDLYLTLSSTADTAWRYQSTSSFTVDVEISNDPRTLVLQGGDDGEDVRYRAGEPLVQSTYSSVTLVLYVADAAAAQPDRVLGHAVDHDVFGEYLPEGEAEPASDDVLARAEEMGFLPTLRLGSGSQTYVLTSVWLPFGTTTNGWVTLYGPEGETAPEQLVGVDPRRVDLYVFNQQE